MHVKQAIVDAISRYGERVQRDSGIPGRVVEFELHTGTAPGWSLVSAFKGRLLMASNRRYLSGRTQITVFVTSEFPDLPFAFRATTYEPMETAQADETLRRFVANGLASM